MKHATNPITKADQLFERAKKRENEEKSDVHYIYCSEKMYEDMLNRLHAERYIIEPKTVAGTQGFHCFKPVDESQIGASILSHPFKPKTFKLL